MLNEINFKKVIKDIQAQLLKNHNILIPLTSIKDLYCDSEYKLGSCKIGNNEYFFNLTKNNNYKINSLKIFYI